MRLKKFNENFDEFENQFGEEEQDLFGDDFDTMGSEDESSDFQSSVFSSIENDISILDEDEAEDYLKSIISFCNNQLDGLV